MKNTIPHPKLITLIILIILSISFLTIQTKSQNPYGELLIVDAGGEGDFIKIQSAIDNASSGDKILIKNGLYKENNIQINNKIIIEGENQEKTIIDCEGKKGFIINTCCVEITNLKIMNSGESAIHILEGYNKCEINSVEIINVENTGLWIQGPETKVLGCTIKGTNQGMGIKLRKSDTVVDQTTIHAFDTGLMILINSNDHIIKNSVFYNNEKAIDIRIDSNDNIVKNCDISYNTYGIYIWQNSNDNLVYQNNFWKNTENAFTETTNKWDNGTIGNYWDDYTLEERKNDLVGNNSYSINSESKDNNPLIQPVPSKVLRKPVSVRVTSFLNDDTPSFTWLPSIYIKEIEGYIVKIDSNPETFIGNITSWTSPINLNNGIHTFYVKARAVDNTTSDYATTTFVVDTTTDDSDGDGWTDAEEQEYGTDPYDSDNYPLDTDNDNLPDSIDTDDDNDGYPDEMEESYNSNPKNAKSTPVDTDDDKIPDNDSIDGLFTGDTDDDNDGLTDSIEEKLGSNPKNNDDVKRIYVKGKEYYLVDTNQNNIYNLLYNSKNENTYAVDVSDGNYLIDLDGDGSWDYIYQTKIDEVKTYNQETDYKTYLVFVIIATILSAFIIRYYLVNNKKDKSLKKEKTKKKISTKNIDSEEDKISTINVTKSLLYDMQDTVSKYVEQLDEIEKQIKKSEQTSDAEKNIISVKQKTKDKELWKQKLKKSPYEDIETKVDSIIFEKMVDKKNDVSTMDVDDEVDSLISKHFSKFKR